MLYARYAVLVLLFYLIKILDDAGVFYVLLVAFGKLLLKVLIYLRFYIYEEDVVKYDVVGIDCGHFLGVFGLILVGRNDGSGHPIVAISEVEDYNAEATFYTSVNLQEKNLVGVEMVEYSGIFLVDFILYCLEG